MAKLKLMKKEWFNWFDKTFLDNITAWTEYYYINPDSQHWISNNLIDKNGLVYTSVGYGDIIADNGVLNFKGNNLYTGNRYRYPLYVLNLPSGQYTISVTNNSSYVLDIYPQRTENDFTDQIQITPGSSRTYVVDRSILRFMFVFQTQNTTDSWDFTIKISLTRGDTSALKANPPLIKIEDILGVVDLGSLTWVYENNQRFSSTNISDIKDVGPVRNTDIYTNFYNSSITTADKTIFHYQKRVIIYDSNYTSAEAFKEAMQGKYMIYIKESSPY